MWQATVNLDPLAQIAKRLQMHSSIRGEREREERHVRLRADPNQGSCPVTSRRLSQSPSKLKIKALRDTVPLTREQSTERLIIIHTVSWPRVRPMKWTSQDPPFLIGQWCAGAEALGFDVERVSLNEFWHARVCMATREGRATRREGRSAIRPSQCLWGRREFTLRRFSRAGGWRHETQRSD